MARRLTLQLLLILLGILWLIFLGLQAVGEEPMNQRGCGDRDNPKCITAPL